MKSLRARLIGWYIGIGVVIVAVVAMLAAAIVLEARVYEARQAVAAAGVEVPNLIETYRANHRNFDGIAPFLQQHFRGQGVNVRVFSALRAPPPPLPRSRFDSPRRISVLGHLLAVQIKPVIVDFPGGRALVFVDPRSFAGALDRLGFFVLVLGAVVLIASWRIALVVAHHTLEPLVSTTTALRRFGSGAFTKVSVRDEDRGETAQLARAYNAAVDQTTRALAKRDQTESEMRQFVADAGHQLRTPLTVITGYVSGMLQRARSPDERDPYESMLAQARRMKLLIDRLVTLARLEHEDEPPSKGFDPNELVALVRSGFDAPARRRIAVYPAPYAADVGAREADILEAVCALVDNSLKYAPGVVDIAVSCQGTSCVISVADNGPGMAQDDLLRAYDRFYRGPNADGVEGTGLGLSIVRKSVERSGGTVLLSNRPSGGLIATIVLTCNEIVTDRDVRPAQAGNGAPIESSGIQHL